MRTTRERKAASGLGPGHWTDIPVRRSLVAQAANLIRCDGRAGRWPDGLPGERTLAAELQLSRSTLRLALRQLEREGVLQLRNRRRWVSSRQAGGARLASDQVVILSFDVRRRFPFSRILDMVTMHKLLEGAGLRLRIVDDLKLGKIERLGGELADLQRRLQPVCWILFSCPPDIHRWFERRRIPAIISGSRPPDVNLPCVDFDNAAMARHAVGRLLVLGHRRIGLLAPDSGLMGDQAAEAGFLEACGRHPGKGVTCAVYRHDRTPARIAKLVRRFAEEGGLPAALVTTHYAYAITVITWLLGHGLRVPEDVSLVCLRIDPNQDYVVPLVDGYEPDNTRHTAKLARLAIRYARSGEIGTEPAFLLGRERPGATVGPGPAAANQR